MLILLSLLVFFFDFNSNALLKKQSEIHSKVFTKWINHFLKQKTMHIDKIDELVDGKNFNSLIEILFGDKPDVIESNLDDKKNQMDNFINIIQFLESKEISIPKFEIKPIIQKKKLNDLLNIVWNIISNHTIDNIYFNGYKGKTGLLKWINKCTNNEYNNLTDTWANGTTIRNILNKFYPNEINISQMTNSTEYDTDYVISCLRKVGAPVYIDNESINYLDEYTIIIQYASLFHYLSWGYKLNINNNNNSNDDTEVYENANYLYVQTDLPDFNDGMIPKNNLHNYITFYNHVNQNINEHFKINMRSRYPQQVAFIKEDGGKLKVEYNIKMLEKVIQRAGSKPILFMSCIGKYQQGKSTINSGITGNYGYVVGNGNKETTKGVYIDGPYDLNYIYQRFNISIRKNMYFDGNELLSPLVFFFDIEGYDGDMHGVNLEMNNKAFIEMCAPFLCLSSIYILVSDSNANVQEIKDFFERVKVSKLTTFSNKDDSNGVLQLNIVFNKYNSIYNSFQKGKKNNIKDSIKEFQKTMKTEWIGVKPLNKYGIKYEFYPILEGLQPFYENNLFFDVFQYFAKQIVRSIENAAEGKFVRNAAQSINLFHYIVEHFNDPSFEEMIKLLIRSEHVKSFETFSLKSYNETLKQISSAIDNEFEQYCKNFNFNVNYSNIKKRYIQLGDENINKNLKVINDHPEVVFYIEKLRLSITNKIDRKYNDLIKYKYQLINDFTDKIEQKADNLSSEILNQIFAKLDEEKNFDFNQQKIQSYVNQQISKFGNDLIYFKESENLFLLTNHKIKNIISAKKKYFHDIIEKHINNEILAVAQLKEENDLKSKISQIYSKKINDEYWYIEGKIMNQLTDNLTAIPFYIENYKKLFDFNLICQNTISEYILSKQNEIIENICNDFIHQNESNTKIIERLKQKSRFIVNDDIIDSLINSNKNDLTSKINQAFNNAYNSLAKVIHRKSYNRISFRYREIKVQEIRIFPDGVMKTGPWKLTRTERIPFWESIIFVTEPIYNYFEMQISNSEINSYYENLNRFIK